VLPQQRINVLKTLEDCWTAYLQPYTIRAQQWSAKRTCPYEATADVLRRHAQTEQAGGYLRSVELYTGHPRTIGSLSFSQTPLGRNDGLPNVRVLLRRWRTLWVATNKLGMRGTTTTSCDCFQHIRRLLECSLATIHYLPGMMVCHSYVSGAMADVLGHHARTGHAEGLPEQSVTVFQTQEDCWSAHLQPSNIRGGQRSAIRTCRYMAMTDGSCRRAQILQAGGLPEKRVSIFKTPADCSIAYLEPFTNRAGQWYAIRSCHYEEMADVFGRHAQTGHAGGLPEQRATILQTNNDCWSPHLQPYTTHAGQWSAMRTCRFMAMTAVLSRYAHTGPAEGYHKIVLLI